MTSTHSWITEFREYEAVLVCKNELPVAEKTKMLRAFHTFQWNDVSTADEICFAHENTGTIIKYDGNIVAIEFGHSALNDSLSDLFLALAALGWKKADVYHPIETINDLLTDIGRSIPANSDFDVSPGPVGEKITETAEAQNLLALSSQNIGNSLSQSTLTENENTIMSAFREIDGTVNELQQNRVTPVFLLEDEDDDNALPIPKLSKMDQEVILLKDIEPALPPSPAPSPATEIIQDQLTNLDSADKIGSEVKIEQIEQQVELRTNQTKHNFYTHLIEHKRKVRVGKSEFYFDFPDNPISDDEILEFTQLNGVSEVIKLFPGELNEPLRWDFFADVSIENPWFIEKLVSVFFPASDKLNLINVIIELKKNSESTLGDLAARIKLSQNHPLSTLSLAAPGQSFIEINETDVFTIKNILYNRKPQLFVVHVDEMDGSIAWFIAEMLMFFSICYSKSKRRIENSLSPIAPKTMAPAKSDTINSEVTGLIIEMMDRFKKIGIELSNKP